LGTSERGGANSLVRFEPRGQVGEKDLCANVESHWTAGRGEERGTGTELIGRCVGYAKKGKTIEKGLTNVGVLGGRGGA